MRFEKYYNNIGKVNTWPGPVHLLQHLINETETRRKDRGQTVPTILLRFIIITISTNSTKYYLKVKSNMVLVDIKNHQQINLVLNLKDEAL